MWIQTFSLLIITWTAGTTYLPRHDLKVRIGHEDNGSDAPEWIVLQPANVSELTKTESEVCRLEPTNRKTIAAKIAQPCFRQVDRIIDNIAVITDDQCQKTSRTHRQICYPSDTKIELVETIGGETWRACINQSPSSLCDGKIKRIEPWKQKEKTKTNTTILIVTSIITIIAVTFILTTIIWGLMSKKHWKKDITTQEQKPPQIDNTQATISKTEPVETEIHQNNRTDWLAEIENQWISTEPREETSPPPTPTSDVGNLLQPQATLNETRNSLNPFAAHPREPASKDPSTPPQTLVKHLEHNPNATYELEAGTKVDSTAKRSPVTFTVPVEVERSKKNDQIRKSERLKTHPKRLDTRVWKY